MIPPHIRFAILESNVLAALGLKNLLGDILPIVEIDIFSNIDELKSSGNEYIHYFVSSRHYFENTTFFRSFPHKIIVLVAGDMQVAGVMTINVCQSEGALAKAILRLRDIGHMHSSKAPSAMPPNESRKDILSNREIEVAILLCKGMMNKEIADQLNISLSTVITHRKNIMEKLHARSLADIIIYCVMNALVDVGEL